MVIALSDFPEELLIEILEKLEIKELLRCSLVCRQFHARIRDAVVLQYHIEVALAGVEDCGSRSGLSTAERFTELKNVEESWATLRFRKRQKYHLPVNNIWELFGGCMAHGVSTDGSLTRGLGFVELPSVVRGTSARSWIHPDMGVHIRDFTIDPTQDLAVLITPPLNGVYTVHLRAMSTGGDHPRAAIPTFSCVLNTVFLCNFVFQVMNEFLGILFHTVDRHNQDQLIIWNWHTGRSVVNLHANLKPETRIDSFSFVSLRHFVVSRFRCEYQQSIAPTLEVYDFLAQDFSQTGLPPKLVRLFELPKLARYGIMRSMMTRSDPPPQCAALPLHTKVPFHTAPESQVLAISIKIFNHYQRRNKTFMLFVLHSTLLDGLEDGQLPDPSDIVVPWTNWGPRKSRMLPTLHNEETWVCNMHGTRYVRLEPRDGRDFDNGLSIHMLDFNPTAHRHDTNKEHNHGPSSSKRTCIDAFFVSSPTLIPSRDGFRHDVETAMPYRHTSSIESFDYTAIMIDEECLVGRLPGEITDRFEFLCF